MKTFTLLINRAKHQDKSDIYDFGVILLEVVSGKKVNSRNEVEVVNDQVRFYLLLSSFQSTEVKRMKTEQLLSRKRIHNFFICAFLT